MRLAVLYDARVHLPAFHALKAWRLAVMAFLEDQIPLDFFMSVGICVGVSLNVF